VASHIVCIGFDFDMPPELIGPSGTLPLSFGEAGSAALGRLLALLRSRGLHTTWFMPASTIEACRRECTLVVEGGHEIAHAGVAYNAMPNDDIIAADITRTNEVIRALAGSMPRGFRSPFAELSARTVDHLLDNRFVYDSSRMAFDYSAYRVKRGRGGADTSLIELPIGWSFKDYTQFAFERSEQIVLPSTQAVRAVMQSWLEEFRRMKETAESGILTYTMHPFTIGQPDNMLAFESFLARIMDEGAAIRTMEEAAHAAEKDLLPIGYAPMVQSPRKPAAPKPPKKSALKTALPWRRRDRKEPRP
jgi:peptidoglycan/xylan/chitin deacetylase (PgdA/CDA1 family)